MCELGYTDVDITVGWLFLGLPRLTCYPAEEAAVYIPVGQTNGSSEEVKIYD